MATSPSSSPSEEVVVCFIFSLVVYEPSVVYAAHPLSCRRQRPRCPLRSCHLSPSSLVLLSFHLFWTWMVSFLPSNRSTCPSSHSPSRLPRISSILFLCFRVLFFFLIHPLLRLLRQNTAFFFGY